MKWNVKNGRGNDFILEVTLRDGKPSLDWGMEEDWGSHDTPYFIQVTKAIAQDIATELFRISLIKDEEDDGNKSNG